MTDRPKWMGSCTSAVQRGEITGECCCSCLSESADCAEFGGIDPMEAATDTMHWMACCKHKDWEPKEKT